MTDRVLRGVTVCVVWVVAVIAAIVSYTHIRFLGLSHGQGRLAATLLPFSVDGLVLAGSLVLLHETRHGRRVIVGHCMLWAGVCATVSANVGYGASSGPAGALISAWPAGAFILAAEGLLCMLRNSMKTASASPDPASTSSAPPVPPPASASPPLPATGEAVLLPEPALAAEPLPAEELPVPAPAPELDPGSSPDPGTTPVPVDREKIRQLLRAEPWTTGTDLSRRFGVSDSYGRRLKRELASSNNGNGSSSHD
jgi:Protein of unknown function (DUF2637)